MVERSFRTWVRYGILAVLLCIGVLLTQPAQVHAQDVEPPAPGAAGVVLDSIEVRGLRTLDRATVVATFAVPVGSPVTYRQLQDGQRRLWATGQLSDMTLGVYGGEGSPVVLVLQVEERPSLRRIEIIGVESVSERNLREQLELAPGDLYRPDRVAKAGAWIRSELAAKGIPFTRIETVELPVEGSPSQIDLRLEIEEGQRVSIAEVAFSGNDAFTDDELASALGSRPEGFLWFREGTFEESVLDEDLNSRLPEFYASNGHLDFRVVSDTLIIDQESGKARLEIAVEEGPQYRVADFQIEGNRRFPTEQLEQYYQTDRSGLLSALGLSRAETEGPPVFDRDAYYSAVQGVGELYRNQGYRYAQVDPIIEPVEPEEEGAPPTVNLTWRITEGDPAYVRRINIEGNTFTHDRVIREQIFLLPGSVYSEQDILRSYQAISGLGFFETPLPFPTIEDDPQTGDVDITFIVEEQPTGSINFGTSMGGITGISGFIGYDQPNLFGQAKAGSLRWDFGRYQNNFVLQYSDPALFRTRLSGSVSLFNSRDQFFSFAAGERRRRGFQLQFGVPLPGAQRTRAFVGYSLSRTDYNLRGSADDTSLFGRPPGTQSQASLRLRRFTLDSPLFPTIGSELQWTTEFNGGLLGGDGNFTKHTASGQWWVPVGQIGGGDPSSRPVIMALGLSARMGAVVGNADRFPFDRFWLGGVQFGESLRGYEETSVTPRGVFARGSSQVSDIDRLGDAFMVLGAEYALRLTDAISLSTFYEAGNVWRDVREMDPSRLVRGAGVGIQIVTPFGPIGLDYAYGFDQPDPGWQLHFRMGGGNQF